jgi:ABC-type proline/glycine betaine transport system permease subunit
MWTSARESALVERCYWKEETMVFLGAVLLVAVGLLIAVAVRRGTSATSAVILMLVGLFTIPVAVFGVIVMGFSGSPEDTTTGAVLLFGSTIAGGIAIACISRLKKSSTPG